MEKKFYIIKKKSFANALNFIGFNFYQFVGNDGRTVYQFEDDKKFRNAMNGLLALKNSI